MHSRLLAVVLAVGLLAMTGTVAGLPGDAAAENGPPDTLPEAVPDFVGDILDTVDDFISGAVDSLGTAVRELTPN